MKTFLSTRSRLKYANVPNLSARTLPSLLAALVAVCSLENANAQSAYVQHNLVSDVAGLAAATDTNLANPWGIAFSATGPFWISDNHSGFSTVYDSAGTPQTLIVSIPTAAGGTPPAAPTGIVFNNTTNFIVETNKAAFIFAGEDGTISAWSSGTNAVLKADNSTSDTIYKGLALASSGGSNYLYATDFHNGKIDVFDANFKLVTLAGSFLDPGLPVGFAPFGIESFGTNLFVTYAKQDADKEDDVSGVGNGFIDVFDTSGNLIKRFASNGPLNSPWGMAMAPATFGQFGGDLLIGNFGDGKINAFDPVSGAFLGSLADTNGVPVSIEGLWAVKFGNGGRGGNADTLYFTAGISGGGALEDHGLFGGISVASRALTPFAQHNLVSDVAGLADSTDANLANPWGIAFSPTGPFWISDNHTGLSTVYDSAGSPQALVVNIPTAAGGTPPAAPTGIVFNNTTNFIVVTNKAVFIFAGEDGTISAWSSGTNAVLEADNSTSGAIYKGLALGNSGGANYLYATDFHNGKIDVFDGNFKLVTLAGSFLDPGIPAGFAPFGIESFGTNLFVTYAKQDADKEDDVGGLGNGFINVFDTSGNLVKRFASNGPLNSPWGMVMAPASFGEIGGELLIGNFGDGKINAFDPVSGASLGSLADTNGVAISIEGLWAVKFGNGGRSGNADSLYFTAGISGGGALEDHGLFGSISVVSTGFTPYTQNNLVSDVGGLAGSTDTNLANPWGIAFSPTGPFWISDNHSGLSTVYDSAGTPQTLIVTIPTAAGGTPPAAPTGIVFNNTTNFIVETNKATFIFAGEDGTISAWSSGTNAVLKADNSTSETIYKGLALASSGGSNYLYATDFHNGKIDVFDGNFKLVTLAGSFLDPGLPVGYAPFGIESFGTNLFVTYARQDADKEDDVAGLGNGFVNVFDTSGNLVKRFASNGQLDSPWGMAMAPANFGQFGGDLLIGNFGDGKINAFDPVSGVFLGSLADSNGVPVSIEGLWAVKFGNGGKGGNADALYFTAGISGGGALEDHGLFGSLEVTLPIQIDSITATGSDLTLAWTGGVGPYLVQRKPSLSETNWLNVVTTTNQTVIVTKDGTAGFFRISDHATIP